MLKNLIVGELKNNSKPQLAFYSDNLQYQGIVEGFAADSLVTFENL